MMVFLLPMCCLESSDASGEVFCFCILNTTVQKLYHSCLDSMS